ncbi:MAG: hypothetical protein HY721_06000 [Planctomycetes bacterium]|nr:hypothetical protein [Planctomycetota bacterium]
MAMEANKDSRLETEAWRIAADVNFCVSKIVGRYAAYPQVDAGAFRRVHTTVDRGLKRLKGSAVRDLCQELRAVTSCHVSELLRAQGADETDTRIVAIAQVLRERCGIPDDLFREVLAGLLSWTPGDKLVILDALVKVIRAGA